MKFIVLLLILVPFTLFGIIITGTIDEDTIWSPENNPYDVFDIVTITENTTLYIMPGTEVIMDSRMYVCYENGSEYFWENSSSHPGTFYIYGKMIACGTEQDSIVFTRPANSENEMWGCFYIFPDAGLCEFEHCIISYSNSFNKFLGDPAFCCIRCENGRLFVRNCHFYNNQMSISTEYNLDSHNSMLCEITNNLFENLYNENEFLEDVMLHQCQVFQNRESGDPPMFAGNTFRNLPYGGIGVPYSAYNSYYNITRYASAIASTYRPSYFYKNSVVDCCNHGYNILVIEYSSVIEYPVNLNYIKNNTFTNDGFCFSSAVSFSDDAYAEVFDNYFRKSNFRTNSDASGNVHNNTFNDCNVYLFQNDQFNNNLVYGGDSSYNNHGHSISNNVIIPEEGEFGCREGRMIENTVLLVSDVGFDENTMSGLPPDTLRNCIIDFDPDEYTFLIDGGNNIQISPDQIDQIFVDYANGDFHLSEGSIAIDAGYQADDYEYDFLDLDNKLRVWNAFSPEEPVIDIGVYEYLSPPLGELLVNTYNAETEDIVNYVLLLFNGEPSDFEFTDNYGFAVIYRPEGVYEISTKRILYEDAYVSEVEIISGESNIICIPIAPADSVFVEDNSITQPKSIYSLKNYPNPFNPSTVICFTLPEKEFIDLSIYNLKGQKITTLAEKFLETGIHEFVWDGRNQRSAPVASGIYIYKLQLNSTSESGKLLLLK